MHLTWMSSYMVAEKANVFAMSFFFTASCQMLRTSPSTSRTSYSSPNLGFQRKCCSSVLNTCHDWSRHCRLAGTVTLLCTTVCFYTLRSNIQDVNRTFLKNCLYDDKSAPKCPIFQLGDIAKRAGSNFEKMRRFVCISFFPFNFVVMSVWFSMSEKHGDL